MDEPFELTATVVHTRPGAVVLSRSPLRPAGGGQVSEIGSLHHTGGVVAVIDTEPGDEGLWHLLAEPIELTGEVSVRVDLEHRLVISQLHTNAHLLNTLVYRRFAGARVNGAHIDGDGTARIDVDLSAFDPAAVTNGDLRELEGAVNALIAQGLMITERHVEADGLLLSDPGGIMRSLAGPPVPRPDGTIRVVEIEGFDCQACSGSHVANTALSRPIEITRVESKGRRNRRIRFELR